MNGICSGASVRASFSDWSLH
eukprot:COSAG04_NODE_15700_length_523_cov_0.971698_2_plen_20_part_01